MRLYTPDSLLYPISVKKLLRQPGDRIDVHEPLFVYEYKSVVVEWDADKREDVEVERTWPSTFASELEGEIVSLDVAVGQVITRKTLVAEMEEDCKHEVQFGGMCANCGKDMTTKEYNTTVANTARATVNTVHGHTELLISQAEATKADEEAKRRLLDSRRLSLVVDLDQTIIHATVDPTVAEWQRDTANPNHEAVKDVRAFQLVDDGPGARGTWYYIKLRPGLLEFLETISKYYELHIYTMGTRAYAENIAKIIDPGRKIFGERILSRDESGSMTAKNLKRLFPVDTKMVVIIDDRGDVWHWSPNLVKVSVFDFFVGIGDINSSFLPKRPELEAKPIKTTKVEPPSADPEPVEISASAQEANATIDKANSKPISTAAPPNVNGEVSAVDQIVSMAGKQDVGSIKEKSEEQDQTIAEQLEARPLLQKQKILDAAEEEAKTSPAAEAAAELLAQDEEKKDAPTEHHPGNKYRSNLLQDDDTELEYLGQTLRNINRAYFSEYDKKAVGSKGGRIAELRPGHSKKRSIDELENIPDAAIIMNSMKMKVLSGVNIVFSGVVPLGVDIHFHDTAIWAKSFGATVSENITKRTTHVIASPERRTAKVRQAAKKGGRIAIVSQGWLYACFSQWRKVDETLYRIHSDSPANGTAILPESFENKHLALSSSDEETGQTEEDTEDGDETPNGAARRGVSLEIDTDLSELEELEKHKPSIQREDSSPTDLEVIEDWGDIDDELKDFLGSEAEDESDNESELTGSASGERTPSGQRKRKRNVVSDADGLLTVEGGTGSGSRLQKRKKEALSRTSSLTNAASLADISNSIDMKDSDPPGGDTMGGQEDDDDLEAALAAEMERQSEEEDAATAVA